jgi:hypothetical protein
MAARVPLRGRAVVTHRWTQGLEVDCMRRGVELFVLEGDLSLYFREVLTPDGRTRPWLVAQRGGRVVYRGAPAGSQLEFVPGADGFPEIAALRFEAPGVSGSAEFAAPLGAFEPLARVPSPLRWAIAQRTQPRLTWSAPHFEIAVGEGRRRRVFAGAALAKLAYTNPLATEPDRPPGRPPTAGRGG